MRSRSGLIHASLLFAAVFGTGCGDDGGSAAPPDSGSTTYSVGGTITGLTADGLVLENNGGDDLTVDANATSFVFATKVSAGSPYAVTVHTRPTGEACTVTAGSGTANADVHDVSISCAPAVANQWTWASGSDTAPGYGLAGVYGTLGTADAANMPGGREQSASWRDSAGNLWLFGGYGKDSAGNGGQLNDLWKFDPAAGQWTWMSGTNVAPASQTGGAAGSSGVYGTLGTPAAANIPGGREQMCSWVDSSGAVWIFGGEGIDANGVTGEHNDLWKFSGGQWTWMGGSNSVGGPFAFGGPTGVYGTLGTAAPTNVPGGRYGSVCWQDAQGNFWVFGGSGIDSTGFAGHLKYLNDLWKYTPGADGTIGAWTWMAGPDVAPGAMIPGDYGVSGVYGTRGTPATTNYPGGRDAAMTWSDASGNIWMFGGIGIDSAGFFGFMNDLWKYSPSTGEWTWVSGSDAVGSENGGASGVYGTQGTPAADTVPGGRYSAASWIDSAGNLWLLGGFGYDSTGGLGGLNDLWKFDPTTSQWTWMSGSDTASAGGVYGTLGTPAAANTPGARYGIATWTDTSGKLWMFGGLGNDSTGSEGYLNDLWNYLP
jgi:N-acetylneuraminic acid mutarotase